MIQWTVYLGESVTSSEIIYCVTEWLFTPHDNTLSVYNITVLQIYMMQSYYSFADLHDAVI